MSQHVFTQDRMKVLYGWDDPLQYFFLVITELDGRGEAVRTVFSNLDLEEPGMSISQIKAVLADLKIDCPEDLERNLKHDKLDHELNYSSRMHPLLQRFWHDVLGKG